MNEPNWLTEVADRAEKATEGPWTPRWGYVDNLFGEIVRTNGNDMQSRCDGAFIAHARTDVPALVAHVRELRGALRDLLTNTMVATTWELADTDVRPPLLVACETARVADACEALLARDAPAEGGSS